MSHLSLYSIKPRFVTALDGVTRLLAARSVSATSVTLASIPVSIAAGTSIVAGKWVPGVWLLTPFLCLLLMALNAIDGSLARSTGQTTRRGAALNEGTDRLADLAIVGSLFAVTPTAVASAALSLVLAAEIVALIGWGTVGQRALRGIVGKPDRAFLISVSAVAALAAGPVAFTFAAAAIAAGSMATILQRVSWVLAAADRMDREGQHGR